MHQQICTSKKASTRTLNSFPKLKNSGMEERSFSYASTVDVGPLGGAPRPGGFLPGAFFSARGCVLTSLGTEAISKGSSEASCAQKKTQVIEVKKLQCS